MENFVFKTPIKEDCKELNNENKSNSSNNSEISQESSTSVIIPIKINRRPIFDFKEDTYDNNKKRRKRIGKYGLKKKNDNNNIFFVEKILGIKKINGIVHYKCKWIGFPNSENSYEPATSFKDPSIIKVLLNDYKKDLNEKKKEKNDISLIEERTNSKNKEKIIHIDEKSKEGLSIKKKNLKIKYNNDFMNSFFIKGDINKDIPLKITKVLQNNEDPKSLFIEIEWKKRNNGIKPGNSTYTNKKIREKFPYLLLDYYETAILLNQKKNRK